MKNTKIMEAVMHSKTKQHRWFWRLVLGSLGLTLGAIGCAGSTEGNGDAAWPPIEDQTTEPEVYASDRSNSDGVMDLAAADKTGESPDSCDTANWDLDSIGSTHSDGLGDQDAGPCSAEAPIPHGSGCVQCIRSFQCPMPDHICVDHKCVPDEIAPEACKICDHDISL